MIFVSLSAAETQKSANNSAATGMPPIYTAAENGDVKEVFRLILTGADVNTVCVYECQGWTPLMIAAAENHKDVVDLLLANKANPNAQNAFGRTALHFAVRYGYIPIIKSLLTANANPNIQSNDGIDNEGSQKVNSPMADALTQKKDTEILKLLILNGGDPNYKFWDFTPLIQAAAKDDIELVEILLDKNVDVNHKKLGLTALDIAKNRGNKKIIEMLQNRYKRVK
ncbi:MAG: ankyrin repeat domain-containing protein [Elusimicrobiota bacterium]|jgi:serine/threonine-protein phosphatase 6 regulatory ankyrin repeat subunit B|nr:ankyrin repeat domain-containing protein [Elusimicrobiota bacterium]